MLRTPTRRQLTSVVGVLLAVVVWWVTQHGGSEQPPGAESPPASETRTEPSSGDSRSGTDPVSGLPWVAEATLPTEARETLGLIDDGGPFPYPDKDGDTFFNREGLLPPHEQGYYAEYTVPTPGADDRGARRIVTGSAGEFYWTDDHYDSFDRIERSGS